jgi:thiol-disulfide isomerase/thioredoxin
VAWTRSPSWRAAVLAAIVAAALVAAGCSRPSAGGPEGVSVRTAPPTAPSGPAAAAKGGVGQDVSAVELAMADGTKKTVANFKGKVLVLDFWATFCQPCIEKLPGLEKLAAGWGERVAVVAVTLDPDVATAVGWAKAHQMTLPIAAFSDAMKPVLFPGEETVAIPQTRVIGKDGKLAASMGPDGTTEDLKKAVDGLTGGAR